MSDANGDSNGSTPHGTPANGLACPRCGGHKAPGEQWRVWSTQPRPWRIDRIRRCKDCGHQVRTTERLVGKYSPHRKAPPAKAAPPAA